MVQEEVLPAFAGTIAQVLPDLSEMMSLAAHLEPTYSLALRLRTLCRRALPVGSSLHRMLCWQLLKHRQENVRNHIIRLVRYDGQIIWRADGRADSEITNESTAGGRDGQHWAECRCDPVREIVEEEMLPCSLMCWARKNCGAGYCHYAIRCGYVDAGAFISTYCRKR